MQKWISKLLFIVNIILALGLLMSYSAKYISPSLSFIIALSGMAYSYLLVIFLLFNILLLIIKKYKWVLVNGIILLLGWNNLNALVQFNFPNKTPADFRILSYNIRLFDLYNWSNNQESKQEILDYIKQQNPNIVSFQEFYYDNQSFLIDSVAKALDMPYYYVTDSRFLRGTSHFGQAIFSQYPIKNSNAIHFPNTRNIALYCDIEIQKNRTIRVFNNHLESYRFKKNDYQLIEEMKTEKKPEINKMLGLVQRLELALIKRSYQAEKIASLINSSPYPVIVTGDFNDTPNSYTYHQISRYLSDAFVESGWGFSNTYKGSFPSFRIDYILYNQPLKSINYKRSKFDISDHYPIYSDFIFDTNNQ